MRTDYEIKTLKASIPFALLAIIVVVCMLCVILPKGLKTMRAENPRFVVFSEELAHAKDLWFSPDGELLASFEKPGYSGQLSVLSVDKKEISYFSGGQFGPPELPLLAAVSDNGKRVIWARGDALVLEELALGKSLAKPLVLKLAGPVHSIDFLDGRHIVISVPEYVAVFDVESRKEIVGFPISSGVWQVLGRGSHRLLYQSGSVDMYRLSLVGQEPELVRYPASPYQGTLAFVTPFGDVVLGTKRGTIVDVSSSGPGGATTILGSGPIQFIAGYDRDSRMVIGERGGIYLVRHGSSPILFWSTPPGVKAFAVHGDRLALLTDFELMMADIQWRFSLGEFSKWVLALTFSIVSLIAFARVIAVDLIKIRYLRKEEAEKEAADLDLGEKPV